ncbi:hypothetical protein PAXINDRAFT_9322 [Paxillus involutus ATCC 200175]|nr:hypothetical protein PAXINDRAFT_9322 [Paxillus involutus ATCC 200175]
MNNFSKCVCNLLQPFRLYDDMDVTEIVNGNLAISDRDFEVVPDFCLSLRSLHNYGGQALIPWWVGKCGLSSTVTTMLCQLGAAAEMAPEMDLIPKLHRSDFNHTTPVVTLDPIVVGGVTWVEIKSIKLHIFLRGEDGNFNFSGEGLLCAQGSVFPNMQMDTVNQLLNLATKCLFLKITSMMEEVQANHTKIHPLQQASTTASFPCKWSSLFCAAYKQYCKWYNQPPSINNSNDPPPGGPGGPGGPGVPGPSRKWPSTPEPGPSSKRPTSHYSSSRGQQGKSHKHCHSGKKAS